MGKLRQTTEEIQQILDNAQPVPEAVSALSERVQSIEENAITVDGSLSSESINPVQNKVITEELNKKVEGYSGLTISIDSVKEYMDGVGEGIYIPMEISDTSEIHVYYEEPNLESMLRITLNKSNDFYCGAWDVEGDYYFQAKYSNGILILEEPNNFNIGRFQRVEVYDVNPINDLLIPSTIARTDDVNIANAEQNERINELREETTALWESIETKVDHTDLATVNGQSLTNGGNITIEGGGSYDDTELRNELNKKVDKVEGKGLSTNDYTNEDKERVAQGGKTAEGTLDNLYEVSRVSAYGPMHQIEDFPDSQDNNYGVYFTLFASPDLSTVATLSREYANEYKYKLRVTELDGSAPVDIVNITLTEILCGQVATQGEIDALFDNGTSGGGSTSY